MRQHLGLASALGSAALGALVVLAAPAARADLKPPTKGGPQSSQSKLTTDSIVANIAGDHQKGLQAADAAIKSDAADPWGYHQRGSSLNGLGRVDEAVAAFREAERRFPESDPWGKSVAIWGQANALAQVGRCDEAAPLYERFSTFVERFDDTAAAQGRKFAKQCVTRSSVAGPPAAAPATAPPAATPKPATPAPAAPKP